MITVAWSRGTHLAVKKLPREVHSSQHEMSAPSTIDGWSPTKDSHLWSERFYTSH